LSGLRVCLESHKTLRTRTFVAVQNSLDARIRTTMGDSSCTPSPVVTIPNGNTAEFGDGDEPPSPARHQSQSRRHPAWADVPDRDWTDWRWQAQNAVRHPRQLIELLSFSPEERQAIEALQAQYKLAIPPYYFSLIDRFDPRDPIRLQSVPSPQEL